ncbi:hypothetical protein [Desulfosarcina cetonica]|uniref:hypothetical protein n=1 Tax=Desulfosarcina cetonica TaxID=90730 RepID=UPI001C43C244|nr:hypothetical protein [Desulfosarcina cetonica]
MHGSIEQQRFCGREFSAEEVSLIQEVVDTCGGVSRNELAKTVCELLDWKRPNGGLKAGVPGPAGTVGRQGHPETSG